jgi:hypothetical protein
MSTTSSIFCTAALIAACTNTAQEPAASAPAPATASAESPAPVADAGTAATDQLTLDQSVDFCVRLHEQVAPCAGEFIDLNIELREKHFPDFAEKAKDPKTRAAMHDEGIKEVLADGTGPLEPRRQRCKEYAEHGPPTPKSAVPKMEACFAKSACKEKVECMRPVLDERYGKRAPSH